MSISSASSVPSLLSVSSESLAAAAAGLTSPQRLPPPYRPPPPPVSPTSPPAPPPASPPTAPPRRRSSDRLNLELSKENKENVNVVKRPKTIGAEAAAMPGGGSASAPATPAEEAAAAAGPDAGSAGLSVKERTQRFNRMASEGELLKATQPTLRNADRGKTEDDGGDTASVTTLDGRAREWLVRAAQGDHQRLTKLAAEDPRLARLKDPCSGYTALHWGAKHGNEHVVKLIAGTYAADVNARTHGGYTAAHIAMQFNHENIFNLLVKVYGADPNLRDWSGRKPRQYQASHDTAVSEVTFRSEYPRDLAHFTRKGVKSLLPPISPITIQKTFPRRSMRSVTERSKK